MFFFHSQVQNILSIDMYKLENACTQLEIQSFDDDERRFLREYHNVITPVAIALKRLEGNAHTFGMYLPTLYGLRIKLNELSESLEFCNPLVAAIQTGFESRFGEVMDIYNVKSVPLWLAMVTNPKYKLNFIGMKRIPSHILMKVKNLLQNAGQQIVETDAERNANENISGNSSNEPTMTTNTDALLVECDVTSSLALAGLEETNLKVINEVHNYLSTRATTDVGHGLKDFPIIRKLYMKYNCIRSTEAICERMFSYAGEFCVRLELMIVNCEL